MKNLLLIAALSISTVSFGKIQTKQSQFDFPNTVKILVQAIEKKGLTLFNIIDHTGGAKKVAKHLRPTTLIIFGNPKVGTLFMQKSQTMGLSLPLKFLVHEDEDGKVHVSYETPETLKGRHNVQGLDKVFKKVNMAMNGLSNSIVKK